MKILNLYCGVGGNRKLWGDEHEITAVEMNEDISKVYQKLYPNDRVIVGDAHQFLIDNYHLYDFIWSSPPCPTHSITNRFLNARGCERYPDMELYQEIIFLQHFYKGKYVVENVISYYNPLIPPQKSGRHYFWANFKIPKFPKEKSIGRMCGTKAELGETQGELRKRNMKHHVDLSKYDLFDKDRVLRNCVDPKIGLEILKSAQNSAYDSSLEQIGLFNY